MVEKFDKEDFKLINFNTSRCERTYLYIDILFHFHQKDFKSLTAGKTFSGDLKGVFIFLRKTFREYYFFNTSLKF